MFKENQDLKAFESKVWLSSPTMHGPELEYVKEAYETNWMSTVGKNINEVERLAAEKIGCKYAVALSAGTAALHLAMKLAGIKPGDKVFCSDMTFDATVNPVVYEGGVPVFIDTEYDTWNMDPMALEKAFEIYPEVKVVVVAHLYGTPGKVEAVSYTHLSGPDAKNVIFLSADAFGVLPPVSILTPEQTQYYFLSGFTAKLAGTERGITEPTPTFSACFGQAFLEPVSYTHLDVYKRQPLYDKA